MTRLGTVRGLHDLWSTLTGHGAGERPVPLRPLLDTLGLGMEQTLVHLGRERPDWEAFLTWAASTGSPDAAAIARYDAWYDGAEPSAAERARQATLMAEPPVFDDDELAAWERDGVIVLRAAIGRDEAAAIAAYVWTLKQADPAEPSTWYARHEGGIMLSVFQHPAMAAPRRSARIHRGFAQLYGHADLIVSTDRLSFNPPETDAYRFPGPDLHWDTNLTLPIPYEAQGILYLTDTAAEQGALQVVPGFHHRLAAGWLDTLDGRDPRSVDLGAEAVPIAAAAGDLVIWRQDLPHGASPNRGMAPRLAQYVTMYPMFWPDERPWR